MKTGTTPKIAIGISVIAAAVALGWTATSGGTANAGTTPSIATVIAQVQHQFGDGFIRSATLHGSTLTVQTSTPDRSSQANAGFEAAVLGHAIADSQAARGQTPATNLRSLDSNGRDLSGMAYNLIGSDSNASPLPAGTCETAGRNLPQSLTVESARTVPYAGGACVIKVETTPNNAVLAVDKVARAMSTSYPRDANPRNYPALVEVDDANSSPLVILTWVPGLGGHIGTGTAYIKPGLKNGASLVASFSSSHT